MNKPIAVGGEKRSIIASASYKTRKFGVYTPMPTMRARKLCPKLIVLPGDFERYEQFSTGMFSYCYDFTPDVEQTSIDEGYFDLSATRKSPVEIALTSRKTIGQKLKIIVSEGRSTALEEFQVSLDAAIRNGESAYEHFVKLLGKEQAAIIFKG
jgi:nucleotidyltransferase/DNA polymerase involved in DNA repair